MRFLGLDISISDATPARSRRDITASAAILNDNLWSEFGRAAAASQSEGSSAVYSCVKLISETVGSIPCHLLRRKPNGGKERASDRPFFDVLNRFPNPIQTRMDFFEMVTRDLLLRGNAYLLVLLDADGWPSQLRRLHPDSMRIVVHDDFTLTYVYRANNIDYKYNQNHIVHIRFQSDDGVNGRSPLSIARATFDAASTMDEFAARTFANGTRLGGILKHPDTLDEETAQRIATSFRKAYSGPQNAGKVAIIEEGMDFVPVSMKLSDAEFVANRKLSRNEVCGIFGVPPPLIGDLDRATFSNIEHQQLQFVQYCIRNWLVRIELALMRTVLGSAINADYVIEFLVDAILRGDSKSRNESYSIGLQNGFMTFNEVREKENLNPLDWGDATLVPANMKVVASEEDLKAINDDSSSGGGANNDPAALPTPTAKADPGFDAAVLRARAAHAPVVGLSLSRLLSREANKVLQFNTKFGDSGLFSDALRDFFADAAPQYAEQLLPPVHAHAEHLRSLAEMFGVKHSPLPADFVPQWVADFCSRRFNDIAAAAPSAREPLVDAALRKLPESVAGEICDDVATAILGER